MNSKFFYTLILITSLLFNANAYTGDVEKFSNNEDEFLKELEAYLMGSNKKEMAPIFQEFERKFTNGTFNQGEATRIIQISNRMLALKMGAKPYFSSYLLGLTSIKKDSDDCNHFNQWHEVLNEMLATIKGRKFTSYKKFLLFSQQFLENGALRFSKTGLSWMTNAEDFIFQFKEGMPVIEMGDFDLTCVRKDIKMLIAGTSGVFYPMTEIWKGNGGKVTWERCQMSGVYALLGDYEVAAKKGWYKSNNSQFFHPEYFPGQGIEGSIEDKLVSNKKPSYPRFVSKNNNLIINGLGEGITYKGGFRLEGTKMSGVGSKQEKACISIYGKEQKMALRLTAEIFTLKKGEKLIGNGIGTCLYIGQDSICHPSTNIRFDMKTRELSVRRGKRGRDRNPFFSSFHNMNIDIDRIDWNIEKNVIDFGKKVPQFIDASKRVNFESLSYFSEKEYRRYQNVANYNPIALLKIVSEKEQSRTFEANFIAAKINPRFDESSIQSLLYDLVEDGFIDYDKDTHKVVIKEKVFLYAKASQKQTDYDNIRLTSVSDETNGVLNLQNNDLMINGIKSFEFSHEHKIAAIPTGQQVLVKENRNLEFDGQLYAGFGVFQGAGYHFNYDQFQIEMDSVRFMELYIPTGEINKNGEKEALSMGSRIEYLSGVLLMDAPENKSGQEHIDMFPIFNSQGPSYVFYDDKKIQKGCYGRDSFFFSLDPFHLNDMDKEIQKDISFEGTMISADIFPDFRESVVVQEDQSLGFITQTPAAGFPAYAKKGNFTGELSLSNKGLLGKGNISYKWVSIDSDDITFKPKRMLTSAQQFDLQEVRSAAVQVPQVKGYDVTVDWKPYQDSMYIQSLEKPFELFKNGNYTLESTLILTPDGLKGRGVFNSDKGVMSANLFSFGAFSVESDTANLQIKASGVDHLALDTRNVYAKLDFDAQMGYVKANKEDIITTLPYNKFQTSLNEYDWDMANETITFKSKENQKGSFLSIDPNQDSLNFEGETALYHLKNNELSLGGVSFIQTADAAVYPNEGKVEIQPGGIISTLKEAKIVANTTNEYHVITKATVDIKGKKEYTASGFYEYKVGDKVQEIPFNNITGSLVGKGKRKHKKSLTTAKGTVNATDHFYIGEGLQYQGKISLDAGEENLHFEGFSRLDAKNLPENHWFDIDCKADKNNLALQYDAPKSHKGLPLHTGLYLSKADAKMYPLVMSPKEYAKDRAIFEATGLLKYDAKKNLYQFGDSLKIVSGVSMGNLLTYSDEKASVAVEGKFNFGPDNEFVQVTAGGQMKTSMKAEETSTSIDAMTGINFELPEKLWKEIITDISASSFDAPTIAYRPYEFYTQALPELVSNSKTISTQIADIMSKGYMDLPKAENNYNLLFDRLPLKWVADYQSFVTTRSNLGLVSINGQTFNRMMETYIEFKMPTNGDDRLYVYLTSPSGNYYFFAYKQGVMSTVSNNEKYNELVIGLKKKEQMVKGKDGETYEIQPVNPGSAKLFLDRIKSANK